MIKTFTLLINSFLQDVQNGIAKWKHLDFDGSGKEDNLNVYWDCKSKPACWTVETDTIDPLSLLLVMDQPGHDVPSSRDDSDSIDALCEILKCNPGWIRSFQFGWFGHDNKSTSIAGYIMGRNLRLLYLK